MNPNQKFETLDDLSTHAEKLISIKKKIRSGRLLLLNISTESIDNKNFENIEIKERQKIIFATQIPYDSQEPNQDLLDKCRSRIYQFVETYAKQGHVILNGLDNFDRFYSEKTEPVYFQEQVRDLKLV
ncbi:hypothetical protein C0585_02275 [Candidatus Woesearchaeota archaeon]|nr:MAG: hypothetical protein C0585_02275 [Candidatus Woesearchaeota archaeon]